MDPTLAQNWVAIGHSQGGQAVWGVAELMTSLKDPSYRGAVALAPAIDSEPLIDSAATTPGETFYPVFVAYGSLVPLMRSSTGTVPTQNASITSIPSTTCPVPPAATTNAYNHPHGSSPLINPKSPARTGARVTASEFGRPAPGIVEAKERLKLA